VIEASGYQSLVFNGDRVTPQMPFSGVVDVITFASSAKNFCQLELTAA